MQRLGDHRQAGHLDAPAPGLVGGDGLLGDAQQFGQLHLGDALFLAQLGDAAAMLAEESYRVGALHRAAHAIRRSTLFTPNSYTSRMLRWLPIAPEYRLERQLVGAGTILLHLLLVWSLLRVSGLGGSGESSSSGLKGTGKEMVVEFIALPSPITDSRPAPISIQQEPATPDQRYSTTPPPSPLIQSDPQVDHTLSDIGEQVALETQPEAQSVSGGANLSATPGGKPADDLLANYHGALRAAVRRKWAQLTTRPFPTGCTVRLDLSVGGPVNATSASGCDIPQADRMQLEAAVLMAQPLPYAGYESVFTADLPLTL